MRAAWGRDLGALHCNLVVRFTNNPPSRPHPPSAMLAPALSAQRAPAPFVAAPRLQQRRTRASVRVQAADEVRGSPPPLLPPVPSAAVCCLLRHPRPSRLQPMPNPPHLQPAAAPEQQQPQATAATGGCPTCGAADRAFGCDGTGRIAGGIGAVPGFGWWPIKACERCACAPASCSKVQRCCACCRPVQRPGWLLNAAHSSHSCPLQTAPAPRPRRRACRCGQLLAWAVRNQQRRRLAWHGSLLPALLLLLPTPRFCSCSSPPDLSAVPAQGPDH